MLEEKVAALEKTITIMNIKNAGGSVETETTVTVTTLNENIVAAEKDVTVYDVTLNKAATITSKDATVDGMKVVAENTNMCLTVKATGNIDMKNMSIAGQFVTSTNQVEVKTAKEIVITDTEISANGYNGLMIAQADFEVIPEKIRIENINFTGTYECATVTIGATTDNAVIEIKNCTFGKSPEALRFRNSMGSTGVKVLIENCHFDGDMINPESEDVVLFFEEAGNFKSPYTNEDGSVIYESIYSVAKKRATEAGITLAEGEGAGDASYVKRVFPYLLAYEDEANRFGKDKMTIIFKNCTYGEDNTALTANTLKMTALRCSGRASFNAWNENWPAGKDLYVPTTDNEVYLGEYIEEITWEQTNSNSASYPEIIFE
jgi:hypothetical protein